jgi:hypothetical protein
MKYKEGNRVRIQSLEKYNKHKNRYGDINYGCETEILFTSEMSSFCGQVATITRVRYIGCVRFYNIAEDKGAHLWVGGMFEGLVEEETKPNIIEEATTYWDGIKDAWICPQGYQFVDENGNVINAQKIVLEKKKDTINITQEQINAMVHDSCVLFCKHCGCGIPRETCTSLGTCKEHDEYRDAIRIRFCNMNKNE